MSSKSVVFFVVLVFVCTQCQGIPVDDIETTFFSTLNYTLPKFTKKNFLETLVIKPAGNTFSFKCKAEGNPTPNITWYKDGSPIIPVGLVRKNNYNLVIDDLTLKDDGKYSCLVCNIMGCINRTSTLSVFERVYAKPTINRTPKNQTVAVGEYIILTCGVTSDYYMALEWQFVPSDSKAEDDYKLLKTGFGGDIDVFEIVANSTDDEGWYSCLYENTHSKVDAKAYVTVIKDRAASTK